MKISDDGIGIPAGINLEVTETLGLALIKSLAVDQLMGEVKIETEKDFSFQVTFKDNLYTARV